MQIMRQGMTAALLVAMLCGAGQAAQRPDVRDFVRGLYMEGIVEYALAAEFLSEDTGTLIDMLQGTENVQYWGNIATVLALIGDEEAVGALIRLAHGRGGQAGLSSAVYRGRSSAVMSLGYLVNRTGNVQAMEYLLQSTDPQVWIEREVLWLIDPDNAERRRVQMSTSAVLGLALSGRDAAGDKLRELAADEGVLERIREVAANSLDDWERINEGGLVEYYRR